MISLFLPSKKTLILIIGIILVIFILAIISLLSSPSPTEPQPSSSPSSISTSKPLNIDYLPEIIPEPSPETVYSPEILEKDFARLSSPAPLTENDTQIRARLINSLNNRSGYLARNSQYNIQYVSSRDIFMIEILNEDITQAKSQALKWFSSQGLSTEGICNLPVSIYLNVEVKKALSAKNQTFNPIPEGCQQ